MVPETDLVPQADHLTVFFASQTGNAESISRNIHEQAQERGFKSAHFALNDFAKVDWDKEECLVFVVSTTGDGDPPDNSTKFWRHLRKLKGVGLTKAKYAILGLGDTNYDNFCQTAKRLDTRLQELGASPFYARGLADDATGLEETVDPWIMNLWPALAHQVICAPTIHDLPQPHLNKEEEQIVKHIIEAERKEHEHQSSSPKAPPASPSAVKDKGTMESLIKGVESLSVATEKTPIVPATGHTINVDFSVMANHTNLTALPRVPNANLKIVDADSTTTSTTTGGIPSFIQTPSRLMLAKINSIQCLTPADALKRTLSIEFGFEDDVEYAPGDSFGIWAPNDESLVRGVFAALDVKEEDMSKRIKLEGEGNISTHGSDLTPYGRPSCKKITV
ncbi:flavoprotein-like protein [Gamsiella multidivaricata]|uniref:flavoprotein-like protein n=1 Tax=Gamsiella multidivaricata TaxID=101098 RepID=UPI00221F98C9|nr:flavoprotein-like protein [Gamsiella multidivaricata]KAI7825755.1 flavoprotein-like protein [Gamsiella multidivaricata]